MSWVIKILSRKFSKNTLIVAVLFLFIGILIKGLLNYDTNEQYVLVQVKDRNEGQLFQNQTLNFYEKTLHKISLTDKMSVHNVPGISLAFIKNGKLDWVKAYGLVQQGKPDEINTETVFSVGSISKVGTAVIILKLAQKGFVDIDTDVNQYLKSWKIEHNRFTSKTPVTLRATMSHTSGLTVHGFADYLPDEKLPTTVQILKGESPAKNQEVYVNLPVGSRYRYSGGGTTVQQLIVEDITHETFFEAASRLLFEPLKMNRSSYQNPLPESHGNIAKAHNRNGTAVSLPRGYQAMPESAASGLWTTPSDFSKLMIMLMDAYEGKSPFLSKAIVEDMMVPVSPSNYGLGPEISKKENNILFSHGGSNDSYRAQFIGNLRNKNGVIVFTNGTNGHDVIEDILQAFEHFIIKD